MSVIGPGLECKLVGMRQILFEFLHKSKQKFSPLTPIIHTCLSRFRCTVTRNIIPFNLDFVFTELFSVKCPRGMKYDMTQKDCLACPIGYTSEQESSLNCTKCPEKKSTRKEGSKTCEGKHDAVG